MSWTIKPPEGSLRKNFDDAICDAFNNKGILIFCAASDQGKSADLTYPYGSDNRSFRIGVAKATGKTTETVSDVQGLDFVFPGHRVRFEAHSGSSVANAIAFGLVDLVIECVRLGVLHSQKMGRVDPSTALNKDDLRKIQQRYHMALAMQSIGTNQNTNNKYIEVWDTVDARGKTLSDNEGSSIHQLDTIAALARHFVKK